MFETADHAEIPVPDPFRAQGERVWAYVEIALHVPWFCLVYRVPDDEGGGHLRRSIFLSEVRQLVEFQARGPKIYEVQVVLPSHLTGARRWTMQPLAEVWEGVEPKAKGQKSYVYVLANGKRYLNSGLTENETDLIDRKRIYKRA